MIEVIVMCIAVSAVRQSCGAFHYIALNYSVLIQCNT
jgi:hypothetical protein